MPKYTITAARHQVIHRDDKNRIIRVERLGKGDTVEMPEADARALVAAGGLAPVSADGEDATETPLRTPTPQTPAGSPETTPAADSGQTADEGQEQEEEVSGEEPTSETPDDGYDTLTYPALQAEAKKRGLNGGGSTQELIARLRADDADA